jgi:hypothetical protein
VYLVRVCEVKGKSSMSRSKRWNMSEMVILLSVGGVMLVSVVCVVVLVMIGEY